MNNSVICYLFKQNGGTLKKINVMNHIECKKKVVVTDFAHLMPKFMFFGIK